MPPPDLDVELAHDDLGSSLLTRAHRLGLRRGRRSHLERRERVWKVTSTRKERKRKGVDCNILFVLLKNVVTLFGTLNTGYVLLDTLAVT